MEYLIYLKPSYVWARFVDVSIKLFKALDVVCPSNGSLFQQYEEVLVLAYWTVQYPGDTCLLYYSAAKGITTVV